MVELEVPDIWAKAISRQHGKILRRVGAHHVVLPEHDMGERVAHLLTGRMLDYIEVDENFAMAKTTPPRPTSSASRCTSPGYRASNVTIVAVKSQAQGPGASFVYTTPDTVLRYGDVILVIGRITDVERFAEAE